LKITPTILNRFSHLHTFFCAFAAGAGACPAMIILVFTAFRCAFRANFSTQAAELICPAAAQAHKLGCVIAGSGAFHIELNTVNHHIYVFFL
jgi:hypothetical protein